MLMHSTPNPTTGVMAGGQKPFTYLYSSLSSIDKSPTLDQRNFDPALSSSSSLVGRHYRPGQSWLHPNTFDRLRRRASDILPFGWDVGVGPTAMDQHSLETYSNFLVAPIATPENLSDESMTGSRTSLPKRRTHHFWKRMRWENEYCGRSSVGDATESSSVYCASPLSAVRGRGGGGGSGDGSGVLPPATSDAESLSSTRAQLKKEILRLYQRAAADLDANGAPLADGAAAGLSGVSQPMDAKISGGSNSESPPDSSVSQSQSFFPFTAENMSPVFGARGSISISSQDQASPIQRPATTNGCISPHVDNPLPPCNTSF